MKKGFTLIELLVGIIVSAIVVTIAWRSYTSIYTDVFRNRQKDDRNESIEVFQGVLERKLAQIQKVVSLEEDRVIWQNAEFQKEELSWTDTSISWNEKPVFRTDSMKNVKIEMQSLPFSEESSLSEYDLDGDLFLMGEELDIDYSGDLNLKECLQIAYINIAFDYGYRKYKSKVFLRNQVRWAHD